MIPKDKVIKMILVFLVFSAGIFFVVKLPFLWKTKSSLSSAVNMPAKVKTTDIDSSKENSSALKDAQAVRGTEVNAKNLDLNNYVLQVIDTYRGSKYAYLLNNDYEHYNGVTENIIFKGSLIAKANPDGSKSSHCVGLTYEVFFKAMQLRNKQAGISADSFNNMTVDNMRDFMMNWFAATGKPKTQGDQLAGAIVKYGLGTQIKRLEDVKAGDFIDFSRTKSGHTAVFINWLKDSKGSIVGFKYWSTQESTNGIAYKQEYFSDNTEAAFKGTIDRIQLYIGRVGPITSYKSF